MRQYRLIPILNIKINEEMNIGFIGTGKISSSVVEAICTSKLTDYRIFLSPRNRERSVALENKYGPVKRMTSNQEVLDRSLIVFFALKPDVYKDIISDLEFRNDHIVASLIPYMIYHFTRQHLEA